VTLVADAIPISDAARRATDERSPLEHALGDGEDFELAFAVAPAEAERLLREQPIAGVTLVKVGQCHAGNGLFLDEGGQRRPLAPRGYEHPFEDSP
jgi:thiamine-monophosphate kinase